MPPHRISAGVKLIGHNSIATPEDRSAAFIVRKDLIEGGMVRSASDLKGLTIGVNIERTTSQLYVEKVLGAGGLAVFDVKLAELPLSDMVAGLTNKAIDACWDVEPFVSITRAQGIGQSLSDMGQVFPEPRPWS